MTQIPSALILKTNPLHLWKIESRANGAWVLLIWQEGVAEGTFIDHLSGPVEGTVEMEGQLKQKGRDDFIDCAYVDILK